MTLRRLLALPAALAAGLALASPAQALTWTVNSTADPGDGTCDASCTLRDAILDANGNPGPDTVAFNVLGGGPHTISPATQLPAPGSQTTIDGTTEPDAAGLAPTKAVVIDGGNTIGTGLSLTGVSITIRGLALSNFTNQAIQILAGNNVVAGNFIGTNAAGLAAASNGAGIYVQGGNTNTIGGTTAADRNVISGNDSVGLRVDTLGNTVSGNYIGTDRTGLVDLGNAGDGVVVLGTSNTVGGTAAGAENTISGNTQAGVLFGGGSTNTMQRNFVGPGADGVTGVPNGTGVIVQSFSDTNAIGTPGNGNDIEGNTTDGIVIFDSADNTVESNSIIANGGDGIATGTGADDATFGGNSINLNSGLGIDLGLDGLTPNDAGDADSGSNGLQNFPEVGNVIVDSGGDATVELFLDSTASSSFDVGLYTSSTCDGSGNGEGESFITTATVNTNASGDGGSKLTGVTGIAPGDIVTATATSPGGDTSEFSACFTAKSSILVDTTADSGAGSLRQGILDANSAGGADLIEFDITGLAPHTINPITALPDITDLVTIDGTTEPDFTPPTRAIEIDGSGLPDNTLGLHLASGSGGSTIRGLAVNRFTNASVVGDSVGLAVDSDGNTIVGDYLGTDPVGATAAGNDIGLKVTGNGNTIGSASAGDANVLSANESFGLLVNGGDTNVVKGNLIGVGADGTTDLGNSNTGVSVQGTAPSGNVVGGVAAGERNVISGNSTGVYIDGAATGTDLRGNLLGTNATETLARPNTLWGVLLENGTLTTVRDNLIANSGTTGIRVSTGSGSGNSFNQNRIRDTGGLGIDLAKSGDGNNVVTANDTDDGDSGPNSLQNFPVIDRAVVGNSGYTAIKGTLNSSASGTFTIEAFAQGACNASGNGEGATFLEDVTLSTDPGGDVTFEIAVPSGVAVGDAITTTATNSTTGNTSEFSACKTAEEGLVVNSAAAGGDNLCDAICTFSDALDDAFAPGDDTILFDITGGAQTIEPVGPFGPVPPDTTIDATLQGGSTSTVKGITLDGSSAGAGADGLQLGGGSDVSGLAIRDFDGDGIEASSNDNTVAGNYIGTNNGGTVDAGNGQVGVRVVSGSNNVIGGTSAAARNVISGNQHGIRIDTPGTEVDGNYIGVDRTGDVALPNLIGIHFIGGFGGSSVGGSTVGERNVISGNTAEGVLIDSSDDNILRGNHIGVGATESTNVPNGGSGVQLFGTTEGTQIGGLTPGQGNVIAQNGLDGVAVAQGADDNSIQRNRMRGNGGLGIDLDYQTDNGVTTNDTGDGDPGANGRQNFPAVTTATATASTDTVSGTLNSFAGATYRIEAFVSDSCDPSGNGEGTATFGAPVEVTTNATTGNAPFEITSTGIDPGDVVTTLATHTATGSTSEFSACKTAVAPSSPPTSPAPPASADLELALTADDPTPEPGAPFNYTATLTNRGPGAAVSPQVTVTLASSVRFLSALIAQSSGCSGSGRVVTCNYSTLANGEVARRRIRVLPTLSGPLTATATASSSTPDPTPASGGTSVRAVLPKPAVAKQVNVKEVSGTVKIKQPGQGSFRTLDGQDRIRTGSLVDTTNGRVRLTSAAGGGKTQTADFFDGLFKVLQTRGKRPITELRLAGKLAGCKKASAAAKKRKGRRLWGKGKGRFRTRGKRSSALVRGTTWLVEDRCNDTTFTQVRQGVVQVRDFGRKRNVTVRAGRSYVARKP